MIVGVPYKNVKDRREKYHPDGQKHQAYIRFFAQELVPYIDANYPTYQMGLGRALIGDSLAATVSLTNCTTISSYIWKSNFTFPTRE